VKPSVGCYRVQNELFLPVGGAFIALGHSGNAPSSYPASAVDGALQLAGIAMLVLGEAYPRTDLVRDEKERKRSFQLSVIPAVTPWQTGLGVVGTF
jgi:hypothetical protein